MTIDNKYSARQRNLQSILQLLDQYDQLSAKQLASLTGLSIVSINKLLDVIDSNSELIATDYLNTRGRRAKIYKLNYNAKELGVVQLEESNNQIKATYFLTNLAGTIKFKQFNDKKIESVQELTNFIHHQTMQHHPAKVIIGVPGAELDGYLQLSDVESLRGINLPLAVKTATDIETIVVNDANASTYGAAFDLRENENIAVGIYFPNSFGPGVGIVINNRLIHGADGLAGEIEYSTVDSNLDLPQQIEQHVQNIISFLDPNLIIVYADKLKLTALQQDQIKQTIQRNLPLHDKYTLDFERNFEKDYLTGLTTIGRQNLLKSFLND